jgi:hypothetical protein
MSVSPAIGKSLVNMMASSCLISFYAGLLGFKSLPRAVSIPSWLLKSGDLVREFSQNLQDFPQG